MLIHSYTGYLEFAYAHKQLTLLSFCRASIIIGLVVVVIACLAGWFFAPKGETQTYAILYLETLSRA
jgi:hypothetical protein